MWLWWVRIMMTMMTLFSVVLKFSFRPRGWYRNLLVSDEAWLTLGGHVMNRYCTDINLICEMFLIQEEYCRVRPERWRCSRPVGNLSGKPVFSEIDEFSKNFQTAFDLPSPFLGKILRSSEKTGFPQAQFEEKVMCLNIIWGEQIFVFGVKGVPQEEACCSGHISSEIGPTTLMSTSGYLGKRFSLKLGGWLVTQPGMLQLGCRFLVLFWVNIYPFKDGARLHTSNDTMAFLDANFGPRLLSDRSNSRPFFGSPTVPQRVPILGTRSL